MLEVLGRNDDVDPSREPLLSSVQSRASHSAAALISLRGSLNQTRSRTSHIKTSPNAIKHLLGLGLLFLVPYVIGFRLREPQKTLLVKLIVCRHLCRSGNKDLAACSGLHEHECQSLDVETHMAYVQAWLDFGACAVAGLTWPFYSKMLCKGKRRWLLYLVLIGELGYEIWFYWLVTSKNISNPNLLAVPSIAYLLGGGPMIVDAAIVQSINDALSDEYRFIALVGNGVLMGIIEAVSLQLNGMRLFDAKLLSPGSYLLWSILLYLIGGIALRTTHAGKFEQESHVDVDQGSNSNSTSGQPHADRHSRNWRLLLCLVVTILVEFKSAIPTYMLQYTSNVFKNPILEATSFRIAFVIARVAFLLTIMLLRLYLVGRKQIVKSTFDVGILLGCSIMLTLGCGTPLVLPGRLGFYIGFILLALGWAFPFVESSYILSLLETASPQTRSKVILLQRFLELTAPSASSIIFAKLYVFGLRGEGNGPIGLGLPFMVYGNIFAFSIPFAAWVLHLQRGWQNEIIDARSSYHPVAISGPTTPRRS